MAKKFKKYFASSAQRLGQGKGSDRREPQIDPAIEASRWCATFGHRFVKDDPECVVCHEVVENATPT